MDAILLREAGGLGDILQVGSAADLLTHRGYQVHLYTLMDPAILTLARMLRGISMVHTLQVTVDGRRPRGATRYYNYDYLVPMLAHLRGVSSVKSQNKLFDMYCPAWKIEMEDVDRGIMPRFSRAQVFGLAAGFQASQVEPARLRVSHAGKLLSKVSMPYLVVSPWSRDPARSMGKGVYEILGQLAKNHRLVVLDYSTGSDHYRHMDNVWWYPQDFGGYPWRPDAFTGCPDRSKAVSDTVVLVANAVGVVTVDTFCLHVAGSLKKPTVLLDGPTVAKSVARHYKRVVPCSAQYTGCHGCYYQSSRRFVKSCRSEGCKVIDSMSPDDVEKSLERSLQCACS